MKLLALDTATELRSDVDLGHLLRGADNQPGKQGSLAVYQYLKQVFSQLDAEAAEHGLAVFAEHTPDARNRPGAHPNIDRLLEVIASGQGYGVKLIEA